MAEIKKARGGKKNRKVGRNAARCAAYASSHRRETNKLRRLEKHLERFPDDASARKAADLCRVVAR